MRLGDLRTAVLGITLLSPAPAIAQVPDEPGRAVAETANPTGANPTGANPTGANPTGANPNAPRAPRLSSPIGVLRSESIHTRSTVTLRLTINRVGQVTSADVLQSETNVLGETAVAVALSLNFEPAMVQGQNVGSRTTLELTFEPSLLTPPAIDFEASDVEESVQTPTLPASSETPAADTSGSQDDLEYGATATARAPEPGARHISGTEMREVPGAFGDPFRALDILPGVTPILTGLPYFYIRGAPPAGNSYYFDGIALPSLFHFGVGAAVIHPRMIESIDLHNGIAPARYGRHFGGVISATAAPLETARTPRAEFELRAIDVAGYVEAPITPELTVQVAARIGYPGYLISLVAPEVSLSYWDYQLRARYNVNRHDRLEVVSLASYDDFVSTTQQPTPDRAYTRLLFFRNELRFVREQGAFTFGAALRVGFEEALAGNNLQGIGVSSLTIGPRLWSSFRPDSHLVIRIGGEYLSTLGEVDLTGNFDNPVTSLIPRDETQVFGLSRSQGSAYVESRWQPTDAVTIDMGLRADLWITGPNVSASLVPRLRGDILIHPEIHLLAGLGIAQQPAVSPIPLPGLSDLPLSRGLQTGYQADLGAAWEPSRGYRFELRAFAHRYEQMIFSDLQRLPDDICVNADGRDQIRTQYCIDLPQRDNINALAYGGELFIRAHEDTLTAFFSYTLAEVVGERFIGAYITPSYDIRHIANLALQWEPDGHWIGSTRLHVRTGGVGAYNYAAFSEGTTGTTGQGLFSRYEQRLPEFFRWDISVSYRWDAGWSRLRLGLEIVNVIPISRESSGITCEPSEQNGPPIQTPCQVSSTPPFPIPNLFLRSDID